MSYLCAEISKNMAKKVKTAKPSLKGVSSKIFVDESELLIGDKPIVRGYHTQECRPKKLKSPIAGENSRLGVGFYFWIEEIFAHHWGKISKSDAGSYDVYTADLNIKSSLNTVFNEKHYLFFRGKIEKSIQYFKNRGIPVNLEMINRFLGDTAGNRLA